jgi:hypothetical protein
METSDRSPIVILTITYRTDGGITTRQEDHRQEEQGNLSHFILFVSKLLDDSLSGNRT